MVELLVIISVSFGVTKKTGKKSGKKKQVKRQRAEPRLKRLGTGSLPDFSYLFFLPDSIFGSGVKR